jgi:hypothetical protein
MKKLILVLGLLSVGNLFSSESATAAARGGELKIQAVQGKNILGNFTISVKPEDDFETIKQNAVSEINKASKDIYLRPFFSRNWPKRENIIEKKGLDDLLGTDYLVTVLVSKKSKIAPH